MPPGPPNSYRVAIVGASSLRGKEIKQVLEDRNFPASDVILLDESVAAGTLTEAAGEPTFIRALQEDSFERAHFVFFAGTALDAERNWQAARKAGATVIDLTGALAAGDSSDGPTAWIPSLDSILPPRFSSSTNGSPHSAAYSSSPAPVIIACTVAAVLGVFHPRGIAVLLFPPVSERDLSGVEELESQTSSLLSFRDVAKPVFDAQVAFNLLPSYGETSKPSLADTREAVARDVARYLSARSPIPAIQFVQAPVFYGYAFSAYAEMASLELGQLESAFANLGVKVDATREVPTNTSVAGESEIHLARIAPDPNVANAVWLWGVADNLRLPAVNAVRIAEALIAKSR
ncbi:MAG TPA: Asd/ArgC dimerization domain-containing protein [Candidatus Acidoferrales bacterium]